MTQKTLRWDYSAQIPKIVETLVERYKPLRIVLFGSYARGDYTEDSDIDMMIVFEDERVPDEETRRELSIDIKCAMYEHDVPNDVVVTTPGTLEKWGRLVGYVYRPILQEGVTLYERRFTS